MGRARCAGRDHFGLRLGRRHGRRVAVTEPDRGGSEPLAFAERAQLQGHRGRPNGHSLGYSHGASPIGNTATYPPASGTWYVVVHAGPDMQGTNATYLLCGNLFA